ncbi:MAG: hypothetical protein E7185_02910 [Erysipelotrichaceae bacterium]|nr:hypothetical protein [Erysipelotrichaceae bacterium]
MSESKNNKGLRIDKNSSVLDAIRSRAPHWIHHTRKDESYWGGIVYLPECDCSECGYTVSRERSHCPHCGCAMW